MGKKKIQKTWEKEEQKLNKMKIIKNPIKKSNSVKKSNTKVPSEAQVSKKDNSKKTVEKVKIKKNENKALPKIAQKSKHQKKEIKLVVPKKSKQGKKEIKSSEKKNQSQIKNDEKLHVEEKIESPTEDRLPPKLRTLERRTREQKSTPSVMAPLLAFEKKDEIPPHKVSKKKKISRNKKDEIPPHKVSKKKKLPLPNQEMKVKMMEEQHNEKVFKPTKFKSITFKNKKMSDVSSLDSEQPLWWQRNQPRRKKQVWDTSLPRSHYINSEKSSGKKNVMINKEKIMVAHVDQHHSTPAPQTLKRAKRRYTINSPARSSSDKNLKKKKLRGTYAPVMVHKQIHPRLKNLIKKKERSDMTNELRGRPL